MRQLPGHLFRLGLSKITRRAAGTLDSVITNQPAVALTFDDGPDPVFTPMLIELLDEFDAKATFFLIGRQAESHRDIVRTLAAHGHQVANHTYGHAPMPSLPTKERIEDLAACEFVLGVHSSGYFRPPKGLQSWKSWFDVRVSGLRPVTWNVHIEDWADHSAAYLAEQLDRKVRNGSIVLLHDRIDDPESEAVQDRSAMLDGLRMFLQTTKGNFTFVTVEKLLNLGRPHYTNWFIRTEADWPKAARYL